MSENKLVNNIYNILHNAGVGFEYKEKNHLQQESWVFVDKSKMTAYTNSNYSYEEYQKILCEKWLSSLMIKFNVANVMQTKKIMDGIYELDKKLFKKIVLNKKNCSTINAYIRNYAKNMDFFKLKSNEKEKFDTLCEVKIDHTGIYSNNLFYLIIKINKEMGWDLDVNKLKEKEVSSRLISNIDFQKEMKKIFKEDKNKNEFDWLWDDLKNTDEITEREYKKVSIPLGYIYELTTYDSSSINNVIDILLEDINKVFKANKIINEDIELTKNKDKKSYDFLVEKNDTDFKKILIEIIDLVFIQEEYDGEKIINYVLLNQKIDSKKDYNQEIKNKI